jgi:hypothetical protein
MGNNTYQSFNMINRDKINISKLYIESNNHIAEVKFADLLDDISFIKDSNNAMGGLSLPFQTDI